MNKNTMVPACVLAAVTGGIALYASYPSELVVPQPTLEKRAAATNYNTIRATRASHPKEYVAELEFTNRKVTKYDLGSIEHESKKGASYVIALGTMLLTFGAYTYFKK
jgi:hypothetical protein